MRQEALLRVFLQEGGFRQLSLECSVTRSLAKRGLVARGAIDVHWQKPGGGLEIERRQVWALTPEGARCARVCVLKEQLRKS